MNARIRKRMGLTILLCGAAVFLAAGLVVAAGMPTVDRRVTGGGGDHVEGGDYGLDYTMGQPVVGTVGDGSSELCAGFWCLVQDAPPQGAPSGYGIYLPVLFRK